MDDPRPAAPLPLKVVTGVLVLVFASAGAGKLAGLAPLVDNFRRWGYPDAFRMGIGAMEVLVALLLLVPRTAVLGAAGIVSVMLGAIHTHTMIEPQAGAVALCVVLLALAVFVGRARWVDFRRGGRLN